MAPAGPQPGSPPQAPGTVPGPPPPNAAQQPTAGPLRAEERRNEDEEQHGFLTYESEPLEGLPGECA